MERFTYAVVVALVATGIAWLVCHYALSSGGLPHPAEPLWLELHGAAGMFGLVLFGMLLPTHMQRAWAIGRGRASGATLAVAFAVLAATGYGLYYVGDDVPRAWISAAHWVIGLAFPTAFAIHVARLRTTLRRVPND
jgi:hypothetical protein